MDELGRREEDNRLSTQADGKDSSGWRERVRDWSGNRREVPRTPIPRKGRGEGFLGPMPLPWLEKASEVVGGGGAWVAIAIWYRAACSRNGRVRMTKQLRERFHLSRTTVSRGLAELEDAGLVSVERSEGRSSVVTLLPFNHPDALEEDD